MNPLKSLMALGLALGLSLPAHSTPGKNDDQSWANTNAQPDVPKAEGSNVRTGGNGASDDLVVNEISQAVADKSSPAKQDIGARFARYLIDHHYILPAYIDKASKENVAALKSAIAVAVIQAKGPKGAKIGVEGELARLYMLIGPDEPTKWLSTDHYNLLSDPKARQSAKPLNFAEKMKCWRVEGAHGVGCGDNEGPFAGNAGQKGLENDLESWTQGVAEKALAAADQAFEDTRTAPDIVKSVGAHEIDTGLGKGSGGRPGLSSGDFSPKDLYEDGAEVDCVVVDGKKNHCRRISMKLTYNRDANTGLLSEAVTFCDITDIAGDPPGGDCQTVDMSDSQDPFVLNGGQYSLTFNRNYGSGENGSMTFDLTPKTYADGKTTVHVANLRKKQQDQVEQFAKDGLCKVKIRDQNYVCVPFVHALADHYDGKTRIDAAHGALLYYPADSQFNLLRPAKPLFTADNTQPGDGDAAKLFPPLTALGCAGLAVSKDNDGGHLTEQARMCNAGAGKDNCKNFLYLMRNDEGVYEAVSAEEAQKWYKGVACSFPQPPQAPKDPAPTPPAPKPGASGATGPTSNPDKTGSGGDSGGGETSTDPTSCDTQTVSDSYKDYSPIGQSGNWWVFGTNDAAKEKVNADRLCVEKTLVIAVAGVIPPNGVSEGVKDGAGRDYVELIALTAQKWIPIDDRGKESGVSLSPIPKKNEEPVQWDSGTGWKTPIQGRVTYLVAPDKLKKEFLKTLDQRFVPQMDNIADYKFIQAKALEKLDEAETMELNAPKDASAEKTLAAIRAGFGFPPAATRTHFQSEEEIGQLKRGLDAVFGSQKAGGNGKVEVTLAWDKECGAARGNDNSIGVLTVGKMTALYYNCDTGGKFETAQEHLDYLHNKKH